MQQFAKAAVILAIALQAATAYNYNYGRNNGYASSSSSAYDPWASVGMADADWGWRKRNAPAAAVTIAEDEDEDGSNDDDVEKKSTVGAHPMYYNRYTFNKYHAAPKAGPVTLASRSTRPSYNYQPQRSRSSYGRGNMYGFASMGDVDWGRKRSAYDPWAYSSMADSDWGRKKRKRSPGTAAAALDKRHIAHWAARGNGRFRPRRFSKGSY